jgi:uncharacterized membrane protein YqjE
MRGATDEKTPEVRPPGPSGNGAGNGHSNGQRAPDPSRLSTGELVSRIAQDAQGLVKAEIQLAKAELRTDLNSLLASARRASIAATFVLASLLVLLAAAVLALATLMAAWAAALIVAAALLASGALATWLAARARPAVPLERTRRQLKDLREDLPWTRAKSA